MLEAVETPLSYFSEPMARFSVRAVRSLIKPRPRNGGYGHKRGAGPKISPLHIKGVRRCPALPHPPECSTIGAVSLSFRVRNVTGRFPDAITTVTLLTYQTTPDPTPTSIPADD